jgi:hypothetical protein
MAAPAMVRKILLLMLLSFPAFAEEAKPKIAVSGATFVVTAPDGRLLTGPQLVGAKLLAEVDGSPVKITIAAVTRDTMNPNVWLHDFRYLDAQGKERSLCGPGPDGVQAGFPVPGRLGPGGVILASDDGHFELTCSSGAQGKCVRFGYEPEKSTPGGAGTLRDHFNACVHLVRADYGGDGGATTRDGTQIDIYDHIGVQRDEPMEGFSFEAGFGPNGAVCVAHPRIRENISLEQLGAEYPRLSGLLGAQNCDEAAAAKLGALVFVKSR